MVIKMPEKIIIGSNDLDGRDNFINFMVHYNVMCPTHLHYSMEFVVVTDGELEMKVSGTKYRIPPGQTILILPFETHLFESKGRSVCLVAAFSPLLVGCFYNMVRDTVPDRRVIDLPTDIFRYVQGVFKRFMRTPVDEIHALAALSQLCAEFADKCVFRKCPREYDDRTLDAMKYISENYTSDLSLEMVAKKVGMHPASLSRSFTQNFGISFTRHISTLRANHAAKLLVVSRDRNMSITEVALYSGFGSIRSFNRAFSECFGTTPKEFRRTHT